MDGLQNLLGRTTYKMAQEVRVFREKSAPKCKMLLIKLISLPEKGTLARLLFTAVTGCLAPQSKPFLFSKLLFRLTPKHLFLTPSMFAPMRLSSQLKFIMSKYRNLFVYVFCWVKFTEWFHFRSLQTPTSLREKSTALRSPIAQDFQ